MVFRHLLRLLHNDQFIQKLADSRPIRLAAKYTVGIFHRFNAGEIRDILGKIQKMAENATKNTQSSGSTPPKQIGFTETFKRELREGFKELEKKTKKQ
eukprot:XP_011414469.1 PREDICTED: uncharacterized protein NCBP2-AS2 homolog [Crassostrea gigas]